MLRQRTKRITLTALGAALAAAAVVATAWGTITGSDLTSSGAFDAHVLSDQDRAQLAAVGADGSALEPLGFPRVKQPDLADVALYRVPSTKFGSCIASVIHETIASLDCDRSFLTARHPGYASTGARTEGGVALADSPAVYGVALPTVKSVRLLDHARIAAEIPVVGGEGDYVLFGKDSSPPGATDIEFVDVAGTVLGRQQLWVR